MDKKTFDRGREIRSSVLGKEFVDNAFQTADDFNRPLQELVTEYCWGAIWGREELPRKTRSMLETQPGVVAVQPAGQELRLIVNGSATSAEELESVTPFTWTRIHPSLEDVFIALVQEQEVARAA